MRTNPYVQLAFLLLVAGCAQHRPDAAASAAPSPAPLQSCETRDLRVDGSEVVVHANVDGTLGSAVVVHASDEATNTAVLAAVTRDFGAIVPDTRVVTTLNKWGVPLVTDPCGRHVTISAAPSPTSVPSR